MTKNWYSKEFPYPAHAVSKQVDDTFRALCLEQGGKANGAAVFSLYDQPKNAITFYFSPEAKLLAEKADAVTCAKPKPMDKFSLSIGDPNSWKIHFPSVERTPSQVSSHPKSVTSPQRRR